MRAPLFAPWIPSRPAWPSPADSALSACERSFYACDQLPEAPDCGFFAVYDGHGGHVRCPPRGPPRCLPPLALPGRVSKPRSKRGACL